VKIKSSPCEISKSVGFYTTFARKSLLAGEIEGVETSFVELGCGRKQVYNPGEDKLSMLLFLGGEGMISQDEKRLISQDDTRIAVGKPGLFVSGLNAGFSMEAGLQGLSFLEIVMDLTEQDIIDLKRSESRFPYHVHYAECAQYSEAIKSEKTISRMILPEGIVPRVCMGTVETSGPDEVASHTHPMLEQLFLGLKGNEVRVIADSEKTAFGENELLHIPLGSNHGVQVAEGKLLHYLWMDIFSDRDKMDYMSNVHTILEE
jgi:quercetin dioxygenase-like cupin family protein